MKELISFASTFQVDVELRYNNYDYIYFFYNSHFGRYFTKFEQYLNLERI